jgi:hypothetical protein
MARLLVASQVAKEQWCVGNGADCFDQKTYGPGIPINPLDGRFPVLGQYIRGVARFHAQPRYCARWRFHDRSFDRIETGKDRLNLFRESFAANFSAVTIELCG